MAVTVELTVSGLNASRVREADITAIKEGAAKCISGVNATDICCVTVTDAWRRRQLLDGRYGLDGAGGDDGASMRRLTSSAVVSFEVGMSVSESRYDSSDEFSDAVETSVAEGELGCKV